MSNKNAVRTTLAGLGVAGGAALAGALIPVATASADDDIDHAMIGWSTSVPPDSGTIDIFDNRLIAYGYTVIDETGPGVSDDVSIYDNKFAGGHIITNIDNTGTGAQNVVDIDNNGAYAGVANIQTNLWGGGGTGSETSVDIDNNIGTVQTTINETLATDAAPVSVTVSDNVGTVATQVNDPSGGDITFSGNTEGWVSLSVLGDSGSYNIAVDSGSSAVNISDASDLSPIYVGVDATELGSVTANIDGISTLIPAGDEYEFVNGAIDIISTSF